MSLPRLAVDDDDDEHYRFVPEVVPEVDSSTPSSSSSPRPLPKLPRSTSPPPPKKTHSRRSLSASRYLTRERERNDQNLNTLLLLTTQRLDAESARATSADHRATSYATQLRLACEARDRALQDVSRLTEELRLYKAQLDAAQKEIFRAQEVVAKVEKARWEAEADAAKARSRARELYEDKLVRQAAEEGRKKGYREGIERGERVGFENGRRKGRDEGQREEERAYLEQVRSQDDEEEEQVSAPPPNVPPIPPPPQIQIRPVPQRSAPPSPSHSEVIIPPDNWIPTADRDSLYISLPPPHELERRVAASSESVKEEPVVPRRRERSGSNATFTYSPPAPQTAIPPVPPPPPPPVPVSGPSTQSHSYTRISRHAPRYDNESESEDNGRRGHERQRTASNASRGSTRISAYDLVSPPRTAAGMTSTEDLNNQRRKETSSSSGRRRENDSARPSAGFEVERSRSRAGRERSGSLSSAGLPPPPLAEGPVVIPPPPPGWNYSQTPSAHREREREKDRFREREYSRTPSRASGGGGSGSGYYPPSSNHRDSRTSASRTPDSARIAQEWRERNPDVSRGTGVGFPTQATRDRSGSLSSGRARSPSDARRNPREIELAPALVLRYDRGRMPFNNNNNDYAGGVMRGETQRAPSRAGARSATPVQMIPPRTASRTGSRASEGVAGRSLTPLRASLGGGGASLRQHMRRNDSSPFEFRVVPPSQTPSSASQSSRSDDPNFLSPEPSYATLPKIIEPDSASGPEPRQVKRQSDPFENEEPLAVPSPLPMGFVPINAPSVIRLAEKAKDRYDREGDGDVYTRTPKFVEAPDYFSVKSHRDPFVASTGSLTSGGGGHRQHQEQKHQHREPSTRSSSRPPSRSRNRYEEADIPPGVVYPDPGLPSRPTSATGYWGTGAGSAGGVGGSGSASGRERKGRRGVTMSGPPVVGVNVPSHSRMSPNALARPFSIFSDG